jgi:hypothetical protein
VLRPVLLAVRPHGLVPALGVVDQHIDRASPTVPFGQYRVRCRTPKVAPHWSFKRHELNPGVFTICTNHRDSEDYCHTTLDLKE